MKLIVKPGGVFSDPGPDLIRDRLQQLDRESGDFAIVEDESRGDEYYIQTAREPGGGYVIEYREGSEPTHRQSDGDNIAIERVIAAFQRYAAGDGSWPDDFGWQPPVPAAPSARSGCLGLLMAPALAAFGALASYL